VIFPLSVLSSIGNDKQPSSQIYLNHLAIQFFKCLLYFICVVERNACRIKFASYSRINLLRRVLLDNTFKYMIGKQNNTNERNLFINTGVPGENLAQLLGR
jgi:hypothetical protein